MAAAALRDADAAKNALLLAASHEFNTPIAAVAGLADLLVRHPELPEGDIKRMAEGLAATGAELRAILTNLLDSERVIGGYVAAHRRRVDLARLVAERARTVSTADQKITLPTTETIVELDPELTARIVDNLVSNAVRHTPEGTSVHVTLSRSSDGVLLGIDDSGPGIPDAEKEAVFEAFQRRAKSTVGGLGLGLFVVRRFAEIQGGRAWVEDASGGGAAFRVLPSRPSPLSRGGAAYGGLGSLGRPSTRSPTMLRWISAVPPQIVSEREKKNERLQVVDRVVRASPAHARQERVGAVVAAARIWPSMPKMSMASSIVSWCDLGPEHLVARPEGGGRVRAVEGVGQGPVAVDLHDLDLRPRPGQSLADEGVAVTAPCAGPRRGSRRTPSGSAGARWSPTMPRSNPSVVMATFQPLFTPADDVVLRAADVGEEDLVELGGAVDLLDRADLDARLLHGDEEVGDAGVLGGVGVGAGQQEDVVGVLGLGGPDLLAVDHPLVAVELGPGLERRPGRSGVGLAEPLAPRDAPPAGCPG